MNTTPRRVPEGTASDAAVPGTTAVDLTPEQQAREFFKITLHDGDGYTGNLANLVPLPGAGTGTFHRVDDPDALNTLAAKAVQLANDPAVHGVYCGVNLGSATRASGRFDANGITAMTGLWGDVDLDIGTNAGKNHPLTLDDALRIANTITDQNGTPLPPTLIVDTGQGIQPRWVFREPWLTSDPGATPAEHHAHMTALARGFVHTLQVHAHRLGLWKLDSVTDLNRILRVPGTWNRKDPNNPRPVRILLVNRDANGYPRTYNPSVLESALASPDTIREVLNANNSTNATDEAQRNVIAEGDFPGAWRRALASKGQSYTPDFVALMIETGDDKLRDVWEGDRPDLKGDQSSYDAALVAILGHRRETVPNMVEAVMCRRLHAGQNADKVNPSKRVDYIARTIAKYGKPDTETRKNMNNAPAVTVPDIDTIRVELNGMDRETQKKGHLNTLLPNLVDIDDEIVLADWRALYKNNGITNKVFDTVIKKARTKREADRINAETEERINRVAKAGERHLVTMRSHKSNERDTHTTCTDTRSALNAYEKQNGHNLYSYGREEIITIKNGEKRTLTPKLLGGELAARVEFKAIYEYSLGDQRISELREAGAPPEAIGALLDAPDIIGLPPVDRVVRHPFYAADGTLQVEPGYHPGARVLHTPHADTVIPPVPTHPTLEDISHARKMLEIELLSDFAFKDEASRTNTIGGMLTPIMRPMIDGPTPIIAVDAPQYGSGKGLLTEATLQNVCGEYRTTPAPNRQDEWPKQLVTSLNGAPNIAIFDNVPSGKIVDDSVLASVTTAKKTIVIRLVGTGRDIEVPPPGLWSINGNNLTFSGELTRRSVWIRLAPGCEVPDERTGPTPETTWRHEHLDVWAREHRGELLWALLVLAQAWIAARRPAPKKVPVIGSYESWRNVIGGILEHAGIDGLMGNRAEMRTELGEDTDQKWTAMVDRWVALNAECAGRGEEPIEGGAKVILYKVVGTNNNDLTPELLAKNSPYNIGDKSFASQESKFGYGLKSVKDRRFGDWHIRCRKGSDGNVWYLEAAK